MSKQGSSFRGLIWPPHYHKLANCKYFMAPMHKIGLSKEGIMSTIPSAIRSGPMARGRLGIIDAYCYSGVSQIETFISNLWQGTPTGKLALDSG